MKRPPCRGGARPGAHRPAARAAGLVGAGQEGAEPLRRPGRRRPRGDDEARARTGRLPALRRPGGRRRDRGQAGGHAAVGRGVAVARCTPRACRPTSGSRRSPRTAACRSCSRPAAPRPTSPTASTPSLARGGSSTSPSRRRWPGSCDAKDDEHPTWRGKVRALPPLDDARRCARRRSRRSTASSRASPSSATTAASSRWPPARARRTPP